MRLVKPDVEIIEQGSGLEGMYKQIEQAGRNCYQSSHLIKEGSARPFVDRMIESGHHAMLEHGTVYLLIPRLDSENMFMGNWVISNYGENPYSTLRLNKNNDYCITTNYRVLVEHGWLDDLKYLCEPTEDHERRVTARFITQIAITRELNRHRVNSIAEESSRYCNYAKDKFGNEISINLPTFLDPETEFRDSVWCDGAEHELTFENMTKMLVEQDFDFETDVDYWLYANLACEWVYMNLTVGCGWPAQQARTVLPLDTNTTLVHTAFISDWEHFFWLRAEERSNNKPHPDAMYLAAKLKKMFQERGYVK